MMGIADSVGLRGRQYCRIQCQAFLAVPEPRIGAPCPSMVSKEQLGKMLIFEPYWSFLGKKLLLVGKTAENVQRREIFTEHVCFTFFQVTEHRASLDSRVEQLATNEPFRVERPNTKRFSIQQRNQITCG